MFDYVAIDFETATHYMGSACSIGIAAVKGAEIVDTFYSLIRPAGNSFDNDNIAIHSITPEMTESAPTFEELWPQISKYFDVHTPVVAHNAHFDMSVLRLSADFELPDFVYVDSIHIAAYFIGGRMSLDDCAKAAGIDCSAHHNALNDAQVCASLVSCFLAGANCMTLWEFAAKYPACADIRRFSDLKPLKYLGARKRSHPKAVRPSDIQCNVDSVDESNPLFGKTIVFTGQLSMDRADAMQLAVNCGAVVKSAVSRKTNYLVVGIQDKALVGDDGMSTKEEKAYELNTSGAANINILSEEEFLKLSKGEVTV